ncbi:hypothetical protein pdam_00008184 [Pocillopora damicornis]|uniref:G-protein coupled receptors family 1 profile domain-containing protein n=1 Tax=Pocillopora damicornis TaxID=46731 RepID=A0A3M6TC63_POCDA|nr:hypothetical protein pdam_00008184 [Pocillopora damicornis]
MDESENAINSTASPGIHNLDVSPTMMTFSIIYVIIIIASLLGNITVCVVILTTRSLRQSINSCFILSLAVSDLITTCLVMPFDLEQIISFGRWRHGEIMCNVWTTTYLIAVPTSILSLLALTVYRYRLLQEPLDIYKASPLMTRRRASIVVCCLWAYSILFSFAPVFGWKWRPRKCSASQSSGRILRKLAAEMARLIKTQQDLLIQSKTAPFHPKKNNSLSNPCDYNMKPSSSENYKEGTFAQPRQRF